MANKDQIKRAAAAQKKQRVSAKDYFKGIKVEMSKVVWPTRKELGTFTGIVIATCAVFALGFWAIDTGILAALKAVLGITMN
ncbi:preprotein translocase subunit SecE [Clostridiales Family XIII bacterium PM5-7]